MILFHFKIQFPKLFHDLNSIFDRILQIIKNFYKCKNVSNALVDYKSKRFDELLSELKGRRGESFDNSHQNIKTEIFKKVRSRELT